MAELVWTESNLEQLPEDGHRYEIFDGSLLKTPPASFGHQYISGDLYVRLRAAAPSGWLVLTELGIRLSTANLVPDIVVLLPGTGQPGLWQNASDAALVVEIASKSTQLVDDDVKRHLYAKAGIPSYWQIKQDGTLLSHTSPVDGRYQLTEISKPGTQWSTLEPFPVSFDPDDLTP